MFRKRSASALTVRPTSLYGTASSHRPNRRCSGPVPRHSARPAAPPVKRRPFAMLSSAKPPICADLPLFPLHTVLFPGGLLPLKIFETRYLDMARACLRGNAPVRGCLLKSGREVAGGDETLVLESVGCLATIVDCDVEQMGVLLLRTRGLSRFRLMSWRIETDGLLRGMIETIEDDQPMDQAV